MENSKKFRVKFIMKEFFWKELMDTFYLEETIRKKFWERRTIGNINICIED